jgi:hypothetical protein
MIREALEGQGARTHQERKRKKRKRLAIRCAAQTSTPIAASLFSCLLPFPRKSFLLLLPTMASGQQARAAFQKVFQRLSEQARQNGVGGGGPSGSGGQGGPNLGGMLGGGAGIALLIGGGLAINSSLFNGMSYAFMSCLCCVNFTKFPKLLLTVDGGHRAIKYSRFGGVKSEIFNEGTHFMVCIFGRNSKRFCCT